MTNYSVEEYMEVSTGSRFYPHIPGPFHIEDIAIGLSRQNRFNGHTTYPYSVAEHACLMYDKGKEWGLDARTLRTILHHDDAEAYIGDLPRPVKNLIPQFKELETRIDKALAVVFDLICPFPPVVKEMDMRILADERSQAMSKTDNVWAADTFEPLGVTINFWPPQVAEAQFLQRHWECVKEKDNNDNNS